VMVARAGYEIRHRWDRPESSDGVPGRGHGYPAAAQVEVPVTKGKG
jgi:hypothetical protein